MPRWVLLMPLVLCTLAYADDAPLFMATRGPLLFADDFNRADAGEKWQNSVRSFAIKDGVLVGGMRDDAHHPAIAKVSAACKDVVLQFDFRFDGAKNFSVVFNDTSYTGSHAGHVVRLSVAPKWLTLTDDKTGLMSNQWVEKKDKPEFKEQIDRVRREKSKRFGFDWQPGRWYTLVMELVGDEMLVSIDGKPAGDFRSEGFAHPTKTDIHFSVSGRDLSVDNFRLWAAEADAGWAGRRPKLVDVMK